MVDKLLYRYTVFGMYIRAQKIVMMVVFAPMKHCNEWARELQLSGRCLTLLSTKNH